MTETTRPLVARQAPCVVVLARDGSPAGGLLDPLVPGGQRAAGTGLGDPLAEVADRLLARLGGSREVLPGLDRGWEERSSLEDLLGPARAAFQSRFPDPSTVALWQDESAAALLPFWRRALLGERPLVAVFLPVLLAPLARRLDPGGDPAALGALALLERWDRLALAALEGMAVHVLDPAGPLRPGGAPDPLAAFLEEAGVPLVPSPADRSSHPPSNGRRAPGRRAGEKDEERALGGGARPADGPEASGGGEGDRLLLPEMCRLDALLASLGGSHQRFHADPGPESAWTTALLDQRRDLGHLLEGLLWATRHIEPIVRAAPQPARPRQREEQEAREDELGDTATPEDEGPYPLNASEDRRAYHRWLRSRHLPVVIGGIRDQPVRKARTRPPLRLSGHPPLVSVLVPVWRTPLWALERCVGSVLAQDFADWELVLSDDASGDPDLTAYLRSLHRVDRRVSTTALEVNGGISAATNAALAVARGRFVAFLDHDDELAPEALGRVAAAIASEPEADVLYSDEDKIDFSGERFDPLFKPEWSPDLLLSFAFLAHLTAIRRELVLELGGLRPPFDGSQDWDLSLRATEKARKIVHIPEVLYHWRTLPTSTSSGAAAKPWAYEAGLRVIEDALARRGEPGEVAQVPAFPGRYHVRRKVPGQPLVSVIVPFRDEPGLLATCATSLREAPGYDRVELVLVDNGSELPETAELLDRLAKEPDVTIVEAPGPFNWAAINNAAVRQAAGEVLLFANNDIEARVPGWLEALVGNAVRAEVGAVGARLLYPDGTIQHAGVVVGLGGIAGHVLRGLPAEHPGYNSMAIQTRNCSVVTGACMATRREVFESVGGFDERLPVAFNDVDFCLKLREKGYLVVYEPLAELVHHESKSRGHTDDLVEARRILKRWARVILAGDPYMNVNLSHWRYWCPLSTVQEDDRWKTYLETSVSTHGSSSSTSGR